MDKPSVLSLLLLLFLHVSSYSQDRIYKNFSIDEGLPSSEVFDTYQSKDGYIWFATDKGISRFNGYEFENFNTNHGLPGNTVLRFYPQENGQIWCYTLHKQALFYFDEEFEGFKSFAYNELLRQNLTNQSIIKSVYVDKEEDVHIGGNYINGEIIISSTGELKRNFKSPTFYQDTLNRKKIILKPISDSISYALCFWVLDIGEFDLSPFQFQVQNEGARFITRWLIKNEIAITANRKQFTLLLKDRDSINIHSKYSPIGINPISKNHFFVGYEYGGGKILDIHGNIFQSFLEGHSISSLLIDHEGGYWFSTLNAGVFYLKNPSINIYNNDDTTCSEVKSLVKTKKNEIIVIDKYLPSINR